MSRGSFPRHPQDSWDLAKLCSHLLAPVGGRPEGNRLLVPAFSVSLPGGPNGKHVTSPGGLDGSREVLFTGVSKLTVLLYTCCFSCQNFSLLVPSNVRVRKNFPHPSPAPSEESGISGTCSVVSHCKHPTWWCWPIQPTAGRGSTQGQVHCPRAPGSA